MILSHVKLHTLQTHSYGFNPKWIITLLEKWLWTSFLPSFDLECHVDYRESFHFPVSDRYSVNSVADISTSNWNKFWATQCRALSNQYSFKTKQKYPEIRHNYNAVGKMSLREFSRRRSRVEIFKMFKITVSEKLLWSSILLKDRTECLILITLYDTYTKHRANKETPHLQAYRIIITYPFLLPSPLTCRRPETKHRWQLFVFLIHFGFIFVFHFVLKITILKGKSFWRFFLKGIATIEIWVNWIILVSKAQGAGLLCGNVAYLLCLGVGMFFQ